MASPSPGPDELKFARIADLLQLRDQLLRKDLDARLACAFYDTKSNEYCETSCRRFKSHRPVVFGKAVTILEREVDETTSGDFTAVVRIIFCSGHELKDLQEYKRHLEVLWDGATREVQSSVWQAFRESVRAIYESSTPQRPVPKYAQSEPVVKTSKAFATTQRSASAPPSPDVNTPARSQDTKSTSCDSTEPSADDTPVATPTSDPEYIHAEDEICASPPSPSEDHKRRKLKARGVKSGSESTSAPVPKTQPLFVPEDTESTEKIQGTRVELGNSACDETNPFRNVGLPNSQSIFERLGDGAQAPTHDKVGTAGNNGQIPDPVLQDGRRAEEGVKQAPKITPKPQIHQGSFTFRWKPPVAPQEDRAHTMPKYSSPSHTPSKLPTTGLEPDNAAVEVESPLSKETPSDPKPPLEKDSSESSFSPSNNPFKPPATTSEPDNAAVEVDPPLSSRKNSPDPQIPLAEHSEAAASPAYETTPMPWVYPHRKESVIAHNIRNILRTSFDHGYIYILEAPKFFETYKPASINGEVWIKIGISSDVETRVKNLESTCGIPQLSTAYVSSRQYRTLSLKRIERLCQEELNNFRRRLDCGVRSVKCSTMHREWFAVDYKVAERTVERWTQFLDQIPYAEDGRITNHWHDMIERMHGNLKAIDGNKYHGLGDGLDTWFEEST